MKEIPLNKNRFALVDDEDFEVLNQFKWYSIKGRNTFYAVTHRGIWGIPVIRMTNVIMGYSLNGLFIDHKNGNGLDNQKKNLRFVTRKENGQNNQKRREGKTKSKFPGVYWNKGGKWQARVYKNGRLEYLGLFQREEDAAHAYQKTIKNDPRKV